MVGCEGGGIQSDGGALLSLKGNMNWPVEGAAPVPVPPAARAARALTEMQASSIVCGRRTMAGGGGGGGGRESFKPEK